MMGNFKESRSFRALVDAAKAVAFTANVIVAVYTIARFALLARAKMGPRRTMGFTGTVSRKGRKKHERRQHGIDPIEERSASSSESEQEKRKEKARQQEHGDAISYRQRYERSRGCQTPRVS